MLDPLLTTNDCKNCRYCCCFNENDMWENPVIKKGLAEKIVSDLNPKQEFIPEGRCLKMKLDKKPFSSLYYCPMLDAEKGCRLDDDKPFECKIWPLRVMKYEHSIVITVSPCCPVMFSKAMTDVYSLASKLSSYIFAYAEVTPEIVKPYIQGYPILITQKKYSFIADPKVR